MQYAILAPTPRRYDGPAYHYTGARGLHGMVTKHCVWATAYTMLNDELEIRHGVSEVLRAFATWKPGPNVSQQAALTLSAYLEQLEETFETLPIYIVSASKKPTLLNQYQGYAGGEGYAVGFDKAPVLRPFNTAPDNNLWAAGGWLEVFYEPAAKEEYAHHIFDQMVQHESVLALIAPFTGTSWILQDSLAALVSVLKHEAFAAEQEVRHVVTYAGRPHFRAEDRGIVPYLTLGNHSGGLDSKVPDGLLQLTDIYVGPPSATAARRIRTLEQLLEQDYSGVGVKDSELPYLP
ncbi:hypothetical protein JOF42_000360 [Microbacterium phyllosphaerae]|uniref:Uncharacterized protein n=1 Tax=Microbacterium phyllosphaerae TaxID=124798 RepID=A0ABS4WKY4_9MICO|nr:DUF2971 domain-containing protein [Microbacterium phyllosphaerae]MBP2376865.1 hypothetical protein [Microbacterium phyllosphaerae]